MTSLFRLRIGVADLLKLPPPASHVIEQQESLNCAVNTNGNESDGAEQKNDSFGVDRIESQGEDH